MFDIATPFLLNLPSAKLKADQKKPAPAPPALKKLKLFSSLVSSAKPQQPVVAIATPAVLGPVDVVDLVATV